MRKTFLFLFVFWLVGCASTPTSLPASQEAPMALSVSSGDFAAGKPIPADFSCKGRNTSPALSWTGAPAGTASFALIVDDPDAPSGTFVHWVIYNIPAASQGLPRSVPSTPTLADGTVQGSNGAGHRSYDGPCPPSGTHRYFFKLYALDAMLDLKSGATKDGLLTAMQGHILAQGELMGTFSH